MYCLLSPNLPVIYFLAINNMLEKIEILESLFSAADSRQIKEIETECRLSEWSVEDYEKEVHRQDSLFLIAAEEKFLLGFMVTRIVNSETAEIYNLGVRPECRNRKIASRLLTLTMEKLRCRQVREIWLEVRKSNVAAVCFYRKHGFEIQGERRNFYSAPTENAVLMRSGV